MSDLPFHARIALIDQRAREVSVFNGVPPDAGHSARVQARRLDIQAERALLRDTRDAEEAIKDHELCLRLLQAGSRPLRLGNLPPVMPDPGGFVAINRPLRQQQSEIPCSASPSPTASPATHSVSNARHSEDPPRAATSPTHPPIGHMPDHTQSARPTEIIAFAEESATSRTYVAGAGSGAEASTAGQQHEGDAVQNSSVKVESEVAARKPLSPAETPDRDWSIKSVRGMDDTGRYRVRWKPTWEPTALIHFKKKYGYYIVVDKQRQAIYRLSGQPLRHDNEGNEFQKVHWKDSLFFPVEIPDAEIQIRRFHRHQEEQANANRLIFSQVNSSQGNSKSPRTIVSINPIPDRFISQPEEDLAKARRHVNTQWPRITARNDVDLYQAIWEKIHATSLSADRKGKSFAELLRRKQLRPLQWGDAALEPGKKYNLNRRCAKYAVLLQCTAEEATPQCEQCACSPATFAICVREQSKRWGHGACTHCYGREKGNLCVYHRDSVGIDDLVQPRLRLSRATKIVPTTEPNVEDAATMGQTLQLSRYPRTSGNKPNIVTLEPCDEGETSSESETDSEDEAEQEPDDDPSSDFEELGSSQVQLRNDRTTATSRSTTAAGKQPVRSASQEAAIHRYTGTQSRASGHTRRPTRVSPPIANAETTVTPSAISSTSPAGVATPASEVEVMDLSGDSHSSRPAAPNTAFVSSQTRHSSPKARASPMQDETPSFARMVANLPPEEHSNDAAEDVLDLLAKDLVADGRLAQSSPGPATITTNTATSPAPVVEAASTMPQTRHVRHRAARSSTRRIQSSPGPIICQPTLGKRKLSTASTDLYSATPRPSPAPGIDAHHRTSASARVLSGCASSAVSLVTRNANALERSTSQSAIRAQASAHSLFVSSAALPMYSLDTPPSAVSSAAARHQSALDTASSPSSGTTAASPRPLALVKHLHTQCVDGAPCRHSGYGFFAFTDYAPIEPRDVPFRKGELTRFHVRYILRSTPCEWTKFLRGAWLMELELNPDSNFGCIEDFLSDVWADGLWAALLAAKALKPVVVDLSSDKED